MNAEDPCASLYVSPQERMRNIIRGVPETELDVRIAAIANGTWKNFDWPWPLVSTLTQASLPNTTTMICGNPGSRKTWMVMQLADHFIDSGIETAIFMAEENKIFHEYRMLAWLSGDERVLDVKWAKLNTDYVARINRQYEERIAAFRSRLYCNVGSRMRYPVLLEWMQARLEQKAKVLIIDPITAFDAGDNDNRNRADADLAFKAKEMIERYHARLILVTHPRSAQMKKVGTLGDMAGGQTWAQNTQTVIWLYGYYPPRKFSLQREGEPPAHEPGNSSMSLLKTRNGKGDGRKIAFNVGPDLRFQELGLILSEHKDKAEKKEAEPEAVKPPDPGLF